MATNKMIYISATQAVRQSDVKELKLKKIYVSSFNESLAYITYVRYGYDDEDITIKLEPRYFDKTLEQFDTWVNKDFKRRIEQLND